jgi:hypothetical protein
MRSSFTHTCGLFSLAILLPLLAGCIPVADLGEYWDKAELDPALEGDWRELEAYARTEDRYVSFVKHGDYYMKQHASSSSPDIEGISDAGIRTKTLVFGGHAFLVEGDYFDEETNKLSGALHKYEVADDILTIYEFNLGVLQRAIERGEVEGTLPQEDDPHVEDMTPPTILRLDTESIAFIIAMADDPANFETINRYARTGDLEKALEEARKYPATVDTLRNSLVNIELPDLKYFAEGRTEIVLRHLCASPEWKVFEEFGDIICYRRTRENWPWDEQDEASRRWRVSLNGYQTTDRSTGSWVQIRPLFRFTEEGGGAFTNEYNRSSFQKAGPLQGSTHLNLKSSSQGIESYLAVGQAGLWFECFEESWQEARVHTRKALQWLGKFLGVLRKTEHEIEQKGFVADLMPPDAVRQGQPTLEVLGDVPGGIYDVYGWVNPQQAGKVYLKVFNAETDERLSQDRITRRSNEFMGWSEDPNVLFFCNPHISVYEGGFDTIYDARFELWFQPSDGSSERKLVQTTRTISGWER